jgi:acyl carrier protein
MRKDILQLIENSLELEPGSLNGNEALNSLNWSSLAVLSFMSLVDEKFAIVVSPKEMLNCKTVNDLIGIVIKELETVN